MSEIALEPCPCCAGRARQLIMDGWDRVTCRECGLTGSRYNSPEEATRFWNRREAAASLTRQTERVAALEKALKDATAHLAAATSAYERFCRRGVTGDALYTTRLNGFEAATSRARSALDEEKSND